LLTIDRCSGGTCN